MSRFAMLALVVFMTLTGFDADASYIDVSPRRIWFFDTYVGSSSFDTVWVRNYGQVPVDLQVNDNCFSDFNVNHIGCWRLDPGQSCTIRVQFSPWSPGRKWCSIDIRDSYGAWERVDVDGNAVERRNP